MNASTGDGARFRDVFAPDVPERVQAMLRADDEDQSLSLIYWAAGTGAVLFLLGIGLLRRAQDGSAAAAAGWVFLAAVPVVFVAIAAVAAGARRRDRRLRARYRDSHVEAAVLSSASARFPELGGRLVRLQAVLAELRWSRACRDGWLPGVGTDTLAAIEWTVTRRLMETVPIREAVREAAGRGRLADQVAARAAELATLDAAVDADLDQLARTVATAGRIDELLADLRLAEKLAADGPTVAEERLRRALPAADTTDTGHFAVGAGAVEDLLRAQLGALARPVRPGTRPSPTV
jgi:hypothetical protein